MATQITWNLTSSVSAFGGITNGDSVAGAGSMLDTNRVVSALATGSVKESQLADGVTGAVLTISGTLTAARTVTFTDASYTVPGLQTNNVWTGTNRFFSIAPFPPLSWSPSFNPSFPITGQAATRMSQYIFSR